MVGCEAFVTEYKIGVLFTEHSMDVVFAYADRMIVLARGKLIAEGDGETIRNDARVQEVYFGTGKTFQPRAPLHEAAGGHPGQGALQ
jgi:branched-chain amino acid transport system ATP-binding protein